MQFFEHALGLKAPVLQAPMAGAQDHRLTAVVCNAGGLGALPAAMLPPEALTQELNTLQAATSRPFNVKLARILASREISLPWSRHQEVLASLDSSPHLHHTQ